MRTEVVNNLANEVIYQLEYYKKLYFTHKKINKIFLILFTIIIICLIAFLNYYYLKFFINLLIELFLYTSSFPEQISFVISPQTLSNISFLILSSPI